MDVTRHATTAVPAALAAFLSGAIERLRTDPRIVGVAAAGSYATTAMDEFSDLDLLVAVEPDAFDAVLTERHGIAAALGPLLAAFTGEHVGEPRLLICLYAHDGPSGPVHVDLKFVALSDAAHRTDDPIVLWERDGRLTNTFLSRQAHAPAPDLQWIEDRFWVWIHYAAGKVGRGELFEAMDFLAFLRAQVLGPLVLMEANALPFGVRRVELAASARVRDLRTTVASYEPADCLRALLQAARLYRELGDVLHGSGLTRKVAAENEVTAYVQRLLSIASGVE
jgi:predicted nucleotidyltransferase